MTTYDPHLDRTLGDLRRLEAAGIGNGTSDRIALLAMFDAGEPLTMTELGARTRLSRAAVTTLADRLEDCGHIDRELDRSDRRRIHLVLTDTGRQWIDSALTLDLTDLDGGS